MDIRRDEENGVEHVTFRNGETFVFPLGHFSEADPGPTKEEIEKDLRERYLRSHRKYNKKRRLAMNRERRKENRTTLDTYKKCMWEANTNRHGWEFDYGSWIALWKKAGKVIDTRSGAIVDAYALMGGVDKSVATRMCRKDTKAPWGPDNCYIEYQNTDITSNK